MNFEKQGLNIAKIRSKDYDKKFKETPVYITGDKKIIKTLSYPIKEIEIDEEDEDNEVMQHLPYVSLKDGNTRQILYVSGASGSGKSYYTSSYIKEYIRMFPKNAIILFSSLDSDEKLDKFKQIIRVKLDEEFYNKKLTINDFKDTLVIYDDTEMIANKFIQEKLQNIMNLCLTTGRHVGCFMIITSHATNAGHKTSLILKEAHSITLFIKTIGKAGLKYVLETSFGLDNTQIKKIRKLDSRWVTVIKTYPMLIMHEHGIYELNDDDD
jgi:hypothetical protein